MLCSRPITTTGEVTGVGLHISYVVVNTAVQELLQILDQPHLADGAWIMENIKGQDLFASSSSSLTLLHYVVKPQN